MRVISTTIAFVVIGSFNLGGVNESSVKESFERQEIIKEMEKQHGISDSICKESGSLASGC